MKSYGKLLRTDSILNTRIKLAIIGKVESGKTTLLHSLQRHQLLAWAMWEKRSLGPKASLINKTRAAAVDVIRLRDGGEFNAWDLAGGETYLPASTPILNPEASIAILLCDLRDSRPLKVSQIRFWFVVL